LGRRYNPDTSDDAFEQRGMASWYGRQYHGNRTASGEPYDMFAMSAAHPTLPIPSYARVTNVRDRRSVVVRINDRGPFLQDRIIDLSYAAALRLGIANPGSGEVIVQKLTARDIIAATQAAPVAAPVAAKPPAPEPPAATPTVVAALAMPAPPIPEPAMVPPATLAPLPVPSAAADPARSEATPSAAAPVTANAAPEPPVAVDSGGSAPWSVQLGAFSLLANASALRDQISQRLDAPDAGALPVEARAVRIEQTGRLSRVLIGRLADRRSAQALALQLAKLLARETSLYER
jgi:rare lipoprotein A